MPFLAATALVLLPWLNPLAGGPSPAVQPWLVSFASTLLLWALVQLRGGPTRLRLVWPMVVLSAGGVLSLGALRPEIAMLAGALLLVAVAATVAQDAFAAQAVQAGVLAAAVASAWIGLLQYFGASAALEPMVSVAGPGRAFANLRQPNLYATLCWLGAAILLWHGAPMSRGLRAGLLVLLAAGSAASLSRTGFLQGLVLLGLAGAWPGPQRRSRLLLAILALAVHLCAAALLPWLLGWVVEAPPDLTLWRRMGEDADGCGSRFVLWANVMDLIRHKPWTGWGWGELDRAHYLTLYDGQRFCEILDNAHNLPLHLAVELGVPAAVMLVAAGLAWAWKQRPWAERESRRQLAWVLLALVLLHSLLEYPLWYGPFQVVAGAALGWLLPPAPGDRRGRSRAALLTAGLLLATTHAAWDYLRVSQIYLPPGERRAPWREDPLEHARRSWLFAGQAGFAELTLATVTPANAARMHALALEALHYSPEPRVIERLIESATLLGREDEAVLHLARYRAAFPADYARWRAQRLGAAGGAPAQMSRLRRTLEKASGSSSSLLGRVSRT